MTRDKIKLLNSLGWDVECECPLEIIHTDGSFASYQAAEIVVDYICQVEGLKEQNE